MRALKHIGLRDDGPFAEMLRSFGVHPGDVVSMEISYESTDPKSPVNIHLDLHVDEQSKRSWGAEKSLDLILTMEHP